MRTKGQARADRAAPRGRGLPQAPLRRVAASPARPPSPQTSPASRGAPALRDPPTHRDPKKLILQSSAQAGTDSRGAAGPGSASALGVQRPGPGRPSRGRTVLVSRGPTRGSWSLPPRPSLRPPPPRGRQADSNLCRLSRGGRSLAGGGAERGGGAAGASKRRRRARTGKGPPALRAPAPGRQPRPGHEPSRELGGSARRDRGARRPSAGKEGRPPARGRQVAEGRGATPQRTPPPHV